MVAKRRLRIWTFAHIAQKSISHTPRKVSVVETAVQIQEWKHRATGRRGASDATISFRTQGCGSADWKLGGLGCADGNGEGSTYGQSGGFRELSTGVNRDP